MARKKTKTENHSIELNSEQFEKLQNDASNHLSLARTNFANKYTEHLNQSKDPKASLQKAEKESPISLPYEYSIETSSGDKNVISVNTAKDFESIKSF